jgi:hypothetical protein
MDKPILHQSPLSTPLIQPILNTATPLKRRERIADTCVLLRGLKDFPYPLVILMPVQLAIMHRFRDVVAGYAVTFP